MVDGYAVGDGEEARESELPALRQLSAMGYTYMSAGDINAERDSTREVVLRRRLAAAIARLNPGLSEVEVGEAIRQLEEGRAGEALVEANERTHARLTGLSQSGGLVPVTIAREGREGTEYTRVKIIDFDNVDSNDFVVTNQFAVSGHRGAIVPDIVAFVNGIPLVVIECKAPTVPSAIEEAYLKNLRRYQREGTGHERLFRYNHVMVAACGYDARAGTVGSGIGKYSPWPREHPRTKKEIAELNGRSRKQEFLIGTLLSRGVLLDTLRNFVLYGGGRGKRTKMLARQPQYSAVTKCIERIRSESKDKGGVIWHTQGSGKSLSMLWLALLARRKFQNPPIVVITDRRQLDRQITSVFKRHGFANVHQARSRRDLARLLESPRAKTILAVIDKFEGAGECTKERAICLVDEAHRSQFRIKAAQMRKAIPNGIFFAFTGTPLDKEDRNNYRVFGDLLDRYGFEESQADGTTLPILYDGRLARLSVDDESEGSDEMFERVFADIDEVTRKRIKDRYANRTAIMESRHRIGRIAEDIADHYRTRVWPNGLKAMLVTSSKAAAVRYKDALDAIDGAPKSMIIMTETDEGYAASHNMTQEERESAAERFKREDDPTRILIVVDMLLVGYDAPICQAMYLDKGLRGHGLLQAIARVNRTYGDAKTHGLIVDYYGVTRSLRKALADFDGEDVGGALRPVGRLYDELRDAHDAAMAHFDGVNRSDYDAVLERLADERERESFRHAFRRFERLLNTALPDKQALKHVDDLRFMAKVLRLLAMYYDPPKFDIREYGAKVKKIVDEHVFAPDIARLVDGAEIRNENFLEEAIPRIASKYARAALLIHRIKVVIAGIREADPEYADSLRDRLEGIIRKERERRIESLEELAEIYRDCIDRSSEIRKVFGEDGATQLEFSIYHALGKILGDEARAEMAKDLARLVRAQTHFFEWRDKVTVRKQMQRDIYGALKREGLGDAEIEGLSESIIQRAHAIPDDAA